MRRLALSLLAGMLVLVAPVEAQMDGPRVNWPLPKNFNVLGVHRLAGTVNATLTNLDRVEPTLDVENELYLLTYSRSQPIFGRSAVFTAVLPAGIVRTDASLPSGAGDAFEHGLADPSLGATINLYGAPGLMLREYARYDLETVVTLGITGTFPWGQYEADQALNIGGNRGKLRISLPMVQSFTKWVPGDRTTLELVPSVTLLGDNDDRGGFTVEQDAMWAVEAHLSRDVTRNAFLSADYTWVKQGEASTVDPSSGRTLSTTASTEAHVFGATAGFGINDNLQLYVTHMQTVGGTEDPVSLQGGLFRVTLNWGFHRVIERRRTYAGSE